MMRFDWITEIDEAEAVGRALGYGSAIKHITAALLEAGAEFDEAAPVAITMTPPHLFYKRDRSEFSWCFTMHEFDVIPPQFKPALTADGVIVPCHHNKDLIQRYGYEGQVKVCGLGVDPQAYKYKEREFGRGQRFRFLWLGASDKRKGWELLVQAFQEEFKPWEPVELYIKTTGQRADGIAQMGKAYFDGRRLPADEVPQLYYDAHAFVFPSYGEGFGLPALEAMASGALVIAPRHTGLAEFVNEQTAMVIECGRARATYGLDVIVQAPKIKSMRKLMRRAFQKYDYTRETRRRGAYLAHSSFTWPKAATRLLNIVASTPTACEVV